MSRYKTLGGMLDVDPPAGAQQQNLPSRSMAAQNKQSSIKSMSGMQIDAQSLSYTNMLLNPDGSVLTKDHVKELRERQGYCTTCQGEPIKLYEIRKSKLNPLWKAKEQISVMHESYNGVCLKCNPQMDPFIAQRRTSLHTSLYSKSSGSVRSINQGRMRSAATPSDNSIPGSLRSLPLSRDGSLHSVDSKMSGKEVDVSFLRNKQERTTTRDLPHPYSPHLPPDLAGFDVTAQSARFNSSFTSHDLTESNDDTGDDMFSDPDSSPEPSKESVFSSKLSAMKSKETNDWDDFSMPDFSQGSSDTFKSHRNKKASTRSPKDRRASRKRNSLTGIQENSFGELQRSAKDMGGGGLTDDDMDELVPGGADFFQTSFAEHNFDHSSKLKKEKGERSKKKKKEKEKKPKIKDKSSKMTDFGTDFEGAWPDPFASATTLSTSTDENLSELFARSDLFDQTLLGSGDETEVPTKKRGESKEKKASEDQWNDSSFNFNGSQTDCSHSNRGEVSKSSRLHESQDFSAPSVGDEESVDVLEQHQSMINGPPLSVCSVPPPERSRLESTTGRSISPPLSQPEAEHTLPDEEEEPIITRKNPEQPVDEEKVAEIDALLKDVAAAGSTDFLMELLVNTMRSHQESVDIQELCLSYIWDLSKFNDANKSAIMLIGLPEDIIKAMKDFKASVKVQECACGALWSLSVNQFNRTELVRLGAVERIFRALEMHLKMEAFVETAFGALRTLSPDPEVRVTIGQLLGVQRVCRAMGLHRHSTSIQRDGCAFLSNVAVDMEEQVVSIVTYEELEAVIRAMGDHLRNEAVLASACFALKNYTYEEKNLRAVRQFEDVCSLLEDASKYSTSVECRNDATETLDRINMLQVEDESLEQMAYSSLLDMKSTTGNQTAEEAVMSIIDILKEYDWSVKLICYCLDSLIELAKESEEHVWLVAQDLSLRVMINAMERQKMNAKVQEKGCDLMRMLAMYSPRARSAICDVNGSNIVLTAMRKHRGVESVQMSAFAALKALSEDPRCAREVARIGGLTRIRDAYQERTVRSSVKDGSIRSLNFNKSLASIFPLEDSIPAMDL
jgi:hypothetical protein